jgi:hypothetical protein
MSTEERDDDAGSGLALRVSIEYVILRPWKKTPSA